MKKSHLIWILPLAAFTAWWWIDRDAGSADAGAYVTNASPTAPLDELMARGQAEEKPLVLLFTGSSWCPPCKQLADAVLLRPEWENFVRGSILFAVYDFPRGGGGSGPAAERRIELAKRFGIEGFPTLIVVGQDGRVRGRRVGYQGGGPGDYKAWIRQNQARTAGLSL